MIESDRKMMIDTIMANSEQTEGAKEYNIKYEACLNILTDIQLYSLYIKNIEMWGIKE